MCRMTTRLPAATELKVVNWIESDLVHFVYALYSSYNFSVCILL